MNLQTCCSIAAVLLAAAGAASAADASSYGASASATTTASASTDKRWVDKNGDGIIQRDEVTPGSQIEKRFKTRDANNDGQLTPDEYFPPK